MENNSNNKTTTYEVVDFSSKEKNKPKNSFGRSVLLPFFSGILGTTFVIGTCFGVPQIREKIIGNVINPTSATSSATSRY